VKRIPLAVLCFCAAASSLRADPPALYFYPPPAIFGTYQIATPATFRADQITTQFPEIREMSGVSLLICWNTICPREDQYDFSIIDQALAYWGAKGKKVVLGVGTVCFPVRNAQGSLDSATPEWVLSKVSTYSEDVRVIPFTPDRAKQRAVFTLPSYFDPRFVEETRKMVLKLGQRYDGNPALAMVRIGTGILGEDNATFDGLKASIPGWSKSKWLTYCRQMTDIYEEAFHKSQLEFDEGWVSIAEVYGTPEEQSAARAFLQYLNARHVFLAFNGLSTEDYPLWETRGSGQFTPWQKTLITDLQNLQQAKASGCPIGLEAIGPTTGSQMKDLVLVADMVKALSPDRLILFNETAAVLHYQRDHTPGSLDTLLREIPKGRIESAAGQAAQFLQALGYK
jgi:hypothetical protein